MGKENHDHDIHVPRTGLLHTLGCTITFEGKIWHSWASKVVATYVGLTIDKILTVHWAQDCGKTSSTCTRKGRSKEKRMYYYNWHIWFWILKEKLGAESSPWEINCTISSTTMTVRTTESCHDEAGRGELRKKGFCGERKEPRKEDTGVLTEVRLVTNGSDPKMYNYILLNTIGPIWKHIAPYHCV